MFFFHLSPHYSIQQFTHSFILKRWHGTAVNVQWQEEGFRFDLRRPLSPPTHSKNMHVWQMGNSQSVFLSGPAITCRLVTTCSCDQPHVSVSEDGWVDRFWWSGPSHSSAHVHINPNKVLIVIILLCSLFLPNFELNLLFIVDALLLPHFNSFYNRTTATTMKLFIYFNMPASPALRSRSHRCWGKSSSISAKARYTLDNNS